MLQQIFVPSASNHTVMLPEMYYGKKVMITVSTVDEKVENSKSGLTKAEEVRAFFNSFQIDMSSFKFNREEANER